jgi:hypothetical protein
MQRLDTPSCPTAPLESYDDALHPRIRAEFEVAIEEPAKAAKPAA